MHLVTVQLISITVTTTNDKLVRGAQTEHNAQRFLEQHGLTILAQNYRSRWGEIDLVMLDKKTLVFVEVRYRSVTDYGGALQSIDKYKQQRIKKTALCYLQQHKYRDACMRFDVIAASGTKLNWIKNAFIFD